MHTPDRHVLHGLPHDITGQCMQLLHGLCCFDFVSDIPLSPATLEKEHQNAFRAQTCEMHWFALVDLILTQIPKCL
jgi:hypothetical protein